MPMLAHFEELDTNDERRRVPRRALRLGVGSDGGSVTIHDLSLTGALLETSTAMLVGAMLEVELPTAGKVEAEVIWNSGEYYGCQFALPISPSALSAALLQSAPAEREEAAEHDPVSELKELGAEIERLSLRMDSALQRLNKTR